jgi:cell division GTPase FtsZ
MNDESQQSVIRPTPINPSQEKKPTPKPTSNVIPAKKTEQPAEDSNNIGEKDKVYMDIKTLCIGVGQGGSNMAYEVATQMGIKDTGLFILNTSMNDMQSFLKNKNIDKQNTIHIGGNSKAEGSGKDRAKASDLLQKEIPVIIRMLIERKFSKNTYDVVLVFFSTAGGTGSGIGPKLTRGLNSEAFRIALNENNKEGTISLPKTFGVAICPDLTNAEGNISFENTLECLDEINKNIKTTRYFFISNNSITDGETRAINHIHINQNVAMLFKRYLTQFGISSSSTLDKEDRLNSLKIMGVHSLCKIENNGELSGKVFITPEGERVRRSTYEVPEQDENISKEILKHFNNSGIFVDDIIHGFYNNSSIDFSEFFPIVSYNGFYNIAKIAEQYSHRLQLNKAKAQELEDSSIKAASGLKNIEREKEYKRTEFSEITDTTDEFSKLFS